MFACGKLSTMNKWDRAFYIKVIHKSVFRRGAKWFNKLCETFVKIFYFYKEILDNEPVLWYNYKR